MRNKLLLVLFAILLVSGTVLSQDAPDSAVVDTMTTMIDSALIPAPPTDVVGKDAPDDHGHAIMVSWKPSADDGGEKGDVVAYEIFRWIPNWVDTVKVYRDEFTTAKDVIRQAPFVTDSMRVAKKVAKDDFEAAVNKLPDAYRAYPNDGHWKSLGKVPMGSTEFKDQGSEEKESSEYLPNHVGYYYYVDAVTADERIRASSDVSAPAEAYGQWFNMGRTPVFIAVMIFTILTVFFVEWARRGANLYVRPLAGIEAVDEAIGRATEMGKPILYVLGLGVASDVATIASFTILGRVAKRVAEYQTELIVPTYDPIVMSVAQEVVKSSYMDAGRADDYKEDSVFFVTNLQFAYVAAVNGIMLRELPATNVYMGKFFAESLLLAETGALAKSIQIAGTDEIAQIPFFIVACDYTLIGEELFAASAYLGREPVLLGSLKAQDWAKAMVIGLAIIGLLTVSFGWTEFAMLFKVTN